MTEFNQITGALRDHLRGVSAQIAEVQGTQQGEPSAPQPAAPAPGQQAPVVSPTQPSTPQATQPAEAKPERGEKRYQDLVSKLKGETAARNEAEAKLKRMEETGKRDAELRSLPNRDKPSNWEDLSGDERSAWFATEAAKITASQSEAETGGADKFDLLKEISSEFPDLSFNQAMAIADKRLETPSLSVMEAGLLASHADPSLFSTGNEGPTVAPSQATTVPDGSSSNSVSRPPAQEAGAEARDAWKAALATGDRHAMSAAFQNVIATGAGGVNFDDVNAKWGHRG